MASAPDEVSATTLSVLYGQRSSQFRRRIRLRVLLSHAERDDPAVDGVSLETTTSDWLCRKESLHMRVRNPLPTRVQVCWVGRKHGAIPLALSIPAASHSTLVVDDVDPNALASKHALLQ